MTNPEPQTTSSNGGGAIGTGTTIAVPLEPPAPPTTPATTTNGPTVTTQTFTADDIEKARKQEKDKLYERLTKQEEVLKKLQDEQQKRLDAEAKARKDAEEEAERQRQENLTFSQKLEETEKTWAQKMAEMQDQIAQRDALLAREREYQELQAFRAKRLQEEAENIMPEIGQWVTGSTQEEIEAAITRAKETTAAIVSNVTQTQQAVAGAQQQARQQARGAGVTAPPVGPMDNQTGYETLSASDIGKNDMDWYMKNRARLLDAASQQYYQRTRG